METLLAVASVRYAVAVAGNDRKMSPAHIRSGGKPLSASTQRAAPIWRRRRV